MGDAVRLRVGSPPIDLIVRTHARAKRLTLRLTPAGEAIVTTPLGLPMGQVERFVSLNIEWLQKRIEKRPPKTQVVAGALFLFRGAEIRIAAAKKRKPKLADDVLQVSDNKAIGPQVRGFVKHAARAAISVAIARYCDQLNQPLSPFSLRDTRSRWGSCTSEGRLMLSWRLVMAPPAVLDYVVAHECAHLIELNHSKKFWKIVSDISPGYAKQQDWLKQNGARLHSYDFG